VEKVLQRRAGHGTEGCQNFQTEQAETDLTRYLMGKRAGND